MGMKDIFSALNWGFIVWVWSCTKGLIYIWNVEAEANMQKERGKKIRRLYSAKKH